MNFVIVKTWRIELGDLAFLPW